MESQPPVQGRQRRRRVQRPARAQRRQQQRPAPVPADPAPAPAPAQAPAQAPAPADPAHQAGPLAPAHAPADPPDQVARLAPAPLPPAAQAAPAARAVPAAPAEPESTTRNHPAHFPVRPLALQRPAQPLPAPRAMPKIRPSTQRAQCVAECAAPQPDLHSQLAGAQTRHTPQNGRNQRAGAAMPPAIDAPMRPPRAQALNS